MKDDRMVNCALFRMNVGITRSSLPLRVSRRPAASHYPFPMASRLRRFGRELPEEVAGGVSAPAVPDALINALSAMPGAALLAGVHGQVLHATPRARALGLIRGEYLVAGATRDLVEEVAADQRPRERHLRVRRPPRGRGLLDLHVQVTPIAPDMMLIVMTDLSDERRVDAVRRDFVANVSHELKTPVGALSLLSEAVVSAADDAEAVRRFAERIQLESVRLGNLINDIIDLSRLESGDIIERTVECDVSAVIREASDEFATIAQARDIEIVQSTIPDALVLGERSQLLMAVRNLMANALSYSASGTRISVTVRQVEDLIEIDVKDQGIGIPAHDLDRIFERFYRVDPARSRNTGGTGLGLAIVKHVCRIHGGECLVWSELGIGSTFTLRFPQAGAISEFWLDEESVMRDVSERRVEPS